MNGEKGENLISKWIFQHITSISNQIQQILWIWFHVFYFIPSKFHLFLTISSFIIYEDWLSFSQTRKKKHIQNRHRKKLHLLYWWVEWTIFIDPLNFVNRVLNIREQNALEWVQNLQDCSLFTAKLSSPFRRNKVNSIRSKYVFAIRIRKVLCSQHIRFKKRFEIYSQHENLFYLV